MVLQYVYFLQKNMNLTQRSLKNVSHFFPFQKSTSQCVCLIAQMKTTNLLKNIIISLKCLWICTATRRSLVFWVWANVKVSISSPPDPTGLRSAVGNVSGNRYESDCRSRGREFDPGPVPYIRGDWSWNNFYGHSPPFCWIIQEGLLSVTSESMCTKYWLTTCSSLPRKKCG